MLGFILSFQRKETSPLIHYYLGFSFLSPIPIILVSTFMVLCISSRIYNLIMIRYLPLPALNSLRFSQHLISRKEFNNASFFILDFISFVDLRLNILPMPPRESHPRPRLVAAFVAYFRQFYSLLEEEKEDSNEAKKKVIKKTINKLTPSNKWFISSSFHLLFLRFRWMRFDGNFT